MNTIKKSFFAARGFKPVILALFIGMAAGFWATGSVSVSQAASAPPTFADQFLALQQQVNSLQAQVNALEANAKCIGTESCSGSCTNVNTDPNNCGACGAACAPANATGSCTNGTCGIASCNPGFGNCNGLVSDGCETNTANDINNCGTCGHVCSTPNGTSTCTNGICAIASCDSGYSACGTACVTITNDPNNCGACGTVCPAFPNGTPSCANGACGGSCNAGFGNCDGIATNGCETNTQTSIANCGGCAHACTTANGVSSCTNGTCGTASCNAGFGDCDGNPANGCETALTTITNCGTCGHVCTTPNGTSSCTNGSCGTASCNAGFGDCDGNPANGCETPTTTITNCGTCGHVCTTPNGTSSCTNGICGTASCNAGFGDCDGNPANGCETALNSVTNCGTCGHVCTTPNGTSSCTSGQCTVASCNAGFVSCNGGCISVTNDPNNCGTCGHVCTTPNGVSSCTNGTCGIASCTAGFGNCDGNIANGCETNTQTSVANCGGCAHACTTPNGISSCTNGTCGTASCNAGFGDCDGNPANGCETALTTIANCGTCGHVCTTPNGTSSCTNGTCGTASCNAGFGDCDGNAANGCETNISTSVANCGSCGHACTAPNAVSSCTNGTCGIAACTAGFANCNGIVTDGCEVNTSTDANNCGGCGHVCGAPTPYCSNGGCVATPPPGAADRKPQEKPQEKSVRGN